MFKEIEEYHLFIRNTLRGPVYQFRAGEEDVLLAVVYQNDRGWHGAAGTAWITASRDDCLLWVLDRLADVEADMQTISPPTEITI